MVKNIAIGTGRRKTAVARVFVRDGSGKIVVNGKDVKDYFDSLEQLQVVRLNDVAVGQGREEGQHQDEADQRKDGSDTGIVRVKDAPLSLITFFLCHCALLKSSSR